MGGRGFGPDSRGGVPKDMPGAERFDPDYDGPMPEGRTGLNFLFGKKRRRIRITHRIMKNRISCQPMV